MQKKYQRTNTEVDFEETKKATIHPSFPFCRNKTEEERKIDKVNKKSESGNWKREWKKNIEGRKTEKMGERGGGQKPARRASLPSFPLLSLSLSLSLFLSLSPSFFFLLS